MRFTPLVLMAALALPALLAGCTSDNGGDSDAPADVEMRNNRFVPETYEIEVGETVVWKNIDSVVHTVTSDEGLFDSGNMGQGATFSHTFDEPGTYHYHCIPHAWQVDGGWEGMVGTIVVGGGGDGADDATGNETGDA